MKQANLIFILTACLGLLLSGCLLTNQKYVVLKKSQLSSPVWLLQNVEIHENNPPFVNFVYNKQFVVNLPLGIKQAQNAASQKIYSMVADALWKNIGHSKTNSTLFFPENREKLVRECLGSPQGFLIGDIYWELHQAPSSKELRQYYVVWVLLLVPKPLYDKAYLAFSGQTQWK